MMLAGLMPISQIACPKAFGAGQAITGSALSVPADSLFNLFQSVPHTAFTFRDSLSGAVKLEHADMRQAR